MGGFNANQMWGNVDKGVTHTTKVFDLKLCEDKSNQYDGIHGGPTWFRNTRKYIMGQEVDCMQLLPWAEAHGENAITSAEMQWLSQQNPLGCRSDPTIISAHIWSYLNKCFKVNAETLFEKVEMRNGLEAWRMIYKWIG